MNEKRAAEMLGCGRRGKPKAGFSIAIHEHFPASALSPIIACARPS
jgi:hypothetical protein